MISTLKKINFLITKRQRKFMVILTFLLSIGMLLEIFGLGILIPALSTLIDPESIERTPILKTLRTQFSNFSDLDFSIFFLIGIVFIYFFKSLFLVLITHLQNRFLSKTTSFISNKLFESYLNQSYSFHLKNNASELIKNIQIEISYLHTFLFSLISIFIEGGFIISIISTLIYIEPFGAIFIGIFYGTLSFIFLQFTKRKLKSWGDIRQNLDSEVSKITLEGFGGIKDILILGKSNYFIKRFSNRNYLKARIISNQSTVSQIPRFYLEFISIVGLVSFIVLMINQGKNINELITVLGVFVAATFRMIPSLNKIIARQQTLKFSKPSVDTIFNEINKLRYFNSEMDKIEIIKFKNEIEFNKVSFGFHKNKKILDQVNLKIKKGETIGIIGESGSGKSTFIDLLIGLHKPLEGAILVDNIKDLQLKFSWKKNIGYISQSIYLIDDSIKNNIAFGVPEDQIDFQRIDQLIKDVQLERFVQGLEFGIETKVGERGVQISGGQKQRIGIARALYNDPDILILDEATSALDSKTEVEVMESINNFRTTKTIIMIAHRETTLSDCDKIYEVKNRNLIIKSRNEKL